MKATTRFWMLLFPALLAACTQSAPVTRSGPVVVAHRGASGHAPEHTFAAYDLALAMEAEYLEQDIAMTSDGVLVCLHDATLDRTARGPAENCSGRVGSKTLAQLKTCDMGSWFNETYPQLARAEYVGQTIPTLEEVFRRYGRSVNYYIETKTLGTAQPMEAELLRLIETYGLREGAVRRRQILVQSFSAASLQRMHELDAEMPLVHLLYGGRLALAGVADYVFGIGPPAGSTDAELVDLAHARGFAVHPYTVNEVPELERIGALCVDGMFTNFPDRYRALVDAGAFKSCPEPIR